MKKIKLLSTFCLLISIQTFSQVYTNKVVGKKNLTELDSLKASDYPYSLPIWGDKATAKGYKLPYSAGVSVNYFWQESSIIIENLNVGFNGSQMIDLDQVVRFDDATATASAVNIRPDIWLLPFLNVYGIFGKVNTATDISAGIWVPDANNNWSEVFSFKSGAKFDGTAFGIGFTPTLGVGGGWIALDMNVSWTDISALEKPAQTFVFGPRFGKSFNLKKPDSNITIWAGGFRVHLNSSTAGSLPLSDFIETDGLQEKVDQAFINVDERQMAVDNWWNGLSSAQQSNPVNIAKYNTANNALETAGNFLTSIDGALSSAGSSTVQYSLEKSPKDMWNFVVGSQYQFNKHYMWRAEAGFLGSRVQFLTSLQYRFGL